MKKILILVMTAVLAAVFLAGCGNSGGAADATDTPVFSVNDVYDDPMAFSGEIMLNGVVAEFAGTAAFEIADPTARPCCPAQFIMVEYSGVLPQLGEEINITGHFGEGAVFRATEVRRAR